MENALVGNSNFASFYLSLPNPDETLLKNLVLICGMFNILMVMSWLICIFFLYIFWLESLINLYIGGISNLVVFGGVWCIQFGGVYPDVACPLCKHVLGYLLFCLSSLVFIQFGGISRVWIADSRNCVSKVVLLFCDDIYWCFCGPSVLSVLHLICDYSKTIAVWYEALSCPGSCRLLA